MNRIYIDKETKHLFYLLRVNEDGSYLCCKYNEVNECKKTLIGNYSIKRTVDRVHLVGYCLESGEGGFFEATDYNYETYTEMETKYRCFDRYIDELDKLSFGLFDFIVISLKYLFTHKPLSYRSFFKKEVIKLNNNQ